MVCQCVTWCNVHTGLFITIPIVSVGLVYYPWSFIAAFVNRPKVPLSKSDYISAARALFLTAKEIKVRIGATLYQQS